MTPRPLYRWKSFWFGVLVLGFLGWTWARSIGRFDGVTFSFGNLRDHSVLSSQGCVKWTRIDQNPLSAIGAAGLELDSGESILKSTDCFPEPYGWTEEEVEVFGIHYTELVLAYWFLILLFLVPWSAFLAWRWRKIKRLDAAGPEVCK